MTPTALRRISLLIDHFRKSQVVDLQLKTDMVELNAIEYDIHARLPPAAKYTGNTYYLWRIDGSTKKTYVYTTDSNTPFIELKAREMLKIGSDGSMWSTF